MCGSSIPLLSVESGSVRRFVRSRSASIRVDGAQGRRPAFPASAAIHASHQQAWAGRSKKRLKKLVSSQRTAHEPFEEGRRHRSNEKRLDFNTVCRGGIVQYSLPYVLYRQSESLARGILGAGAPWAWQEQLPCPRGAPRLPSSPSPAPEHFVVGAGACGGGRGTSSCGLPLSPRPPARTRVGC